MSRQVAIFGAGGHGREALEVLLAMGVEVVGFVSEAESDHGRKIGLHVVHGSWDWLERFAGSADAEVLCAFGDPTLRKRIATRCHELGLRAAIAIHPSAVVSPRAKIGEGCLVMAKAVVGPDVTLGKHVHINVQASVSHDCDLADFATLSPGCHIPGGVKLGEGAELGTGACAIPKVTIGEWARVGAGACVCDDIAPRTTAVGVPARPTS